MWCAGFPPLGPAAFLHVLVWLRFLAYAPHCLQCHLLKEPVQFHLCLGLSWSVACTLLALLALVLSLVLGVGLAWARGAALMTKPSWWVEAPAAPALSQRQATAAMDPPLSVLSQAP